MFALHQNPQALDALIEDSSSTLFEQHGSNCRTGISLAVLAGAALLMSTPIGRSASFIKDPNQTQERTCFQTGRPYSGRIDLRSDVAIVYGIDPRLPSRIATWRDHGYRIHVMTGVAWGQYQDYLYGRFDGTNHEDEAQTDRHGHKIGHGGDVYYMCPGPDYGKFLCVGVRRALDAGAHAIDLEEPEFWVRGGYSEGFKRAWKKYYGEPWVPPHSSVDAQWRASKLKYFLYRRALQQVFDFVRAYDREHHRHVRCYVPTHSLLNYAHWRIVSPESSLSRLQGCDGYIAQVWTGTARTPNVYKGQLRERTFQTAFLEYGAMQNLVHATGRRIWYLSDPVEDNPNHDWNDYRENWEATLTASLFQPEVSRYEVMPWPGRVFTGRYPEPDHPHHRIPIPSAYATELQTVINALNRMVRQKTHHWNCGSEGIGVVVSDSLMFERGQPDPSDPHMSHIYGLALPLLNHGIPVAPVQLESVDLPGYLDPYKVLLMTYRGMKPLSPIVHEAIAHWVRDGGVLVFWDDDGDPYNHVREWWNTGGDHYATPRQQLFHLLGLAKDAAPGLYPIGKGLLLYHHGDPADLATSPHGDRTLIQAIKPALAKRDISWKETSYLLLRRGHFIVAAGLPASAAEPLKVLKGNFINLFDPKLQVQQQVRLMPGRRYFLLDLDSLPDNGPRILASACKALPAANQGNDYKIQVEGIADTTAVLLLRWDHAPKRITLDGQALSQFHYDPANHLLWITFPNEAHKRILALE